MPTWTPISISEGALVKPSTINVMQQQLAVIVNNLDTTNIACKYAKSDLTFIMRAGDTDVISVPHSADGVWYVCGWTLAPVGFAGADSVTFELGTVSDAGTYTGGLLDTSPAIVAGSPSAQRIDIALATLTGLQGVRVHVSSGALPVGSKYVVITVHVAKMLRKLSEL